MTLRTTPLTDRFGVEIHDVDLSDLDAAGYRAIRAAFEEHSALLFRGQTLDDAAHMRLANFFGPIEDRKADERKPGEAFTVPEVSNITESGETELASTRAGWAEMQQNLREQIRDRAIWHRYAHSRAQISKKLARLPMFNKWPDQCWRAVWTNPVNGREALYIASHAFKIDGLDQGSSATLLDALASFVTQKQFVYRHQWRVGDVLIWDQRAVLHRATPWDYGLPRKLSSLCVSVRPEDGLDAMRQSV